MRIWLVTLVGLAVLAVALCAFIWWAERQLQRDRAEVERLQRYLHDRWSDQ